MAKRIAVAVVIVLLAGAGWVGLQYRSWLDASAARLDASSEVITTAAGSIEVARRGETGPAVLLVHGTPGGYDQTETLADAAADAGYRALAVSRPGYLRTPIDVGRTPAEQADAYVALLEALGIESSAVVGLSGGGPSSIEFALRHPARCWALVDLMGVSRPQLPSETHPADDMPGVVSWLLSSNFGGWLLTRGLHASPEAMLEAVVPDAANRSRILADDAKRASFVALADGALTLLGRRFEGAANDLTQFEAMTPAAFERIRVPTLVLHGTADRNVPLAMGELVAQGVPGAELVTFEGADHFMVVSHADEVFGAMFDFLGRHRP